VPEAVVMPRKLLIDRKKSVKGIQPIARPIKY
jgi:hypothetical protein